MKKNSFRTQFDRKAMPYPVTTSIVTDYQLSLAPDGKEVLVAVGEHDIYPEIQSHAKSVDINEIVLRYQRGDIDVLAQRAGMYGDFTNMPTSYAELYQNVLDAQAYFDSLPLEVRQKFDHSFSKFFTSIGTPEFEAAFSQFNVDNSGVNLNNSDVNANESEVKMNVEKPTE
jgi:hypothetical protein